ncbi:hypothetical protein F4779DRAFT_618673 [Xylariaceae sp. FL0662B]|nr:hypothetical protein F4779DRAFT_618673 [Xylariaceae sp. FL0662B]
MAQTPVIIPHQEGFIFSQKPLSNTMTIVLLAGSSSESHINDTIRGNLEKLLVTAVRHKDKWTAPNEKGTFLTAIAEDLGSIASAGIIQLLLHMALTARGRYFFHPEATKEVITPLTNAADKLGLHDAMLYKNVAVKTKSPTPTTATAESQVDGNNQQSLNEPHADELPDNILSIDIDMELANN